MKTDSRIDGIIVIDKEPGFTSFDVVAKMRGICGQKKVGHTGTLDPDATGVLPICLGKATKVCGMLTDSNKEYIAQMKLGITTDTQDISGTVLKEADFCCDEALVQDVIQSFVGEIDQVPPMYSALKVNGQKLCDLARKGIEVERKSRKVSIFEIEILEMNLPIVTMRVACSKGTYIRTLCHDIGEILGCGAAMASLRRTKAAGFTLYDAYTLEQLQSLKDKGELLQVIKPIDFVYQEYPEVGVNEAGLLLAKNGNKIPAEFITFWDKTSQMVRLYSEEKQFIGLFEYRKEYDVFKPYRMFYGE